MVGDQRLGSDVGPVDEAHVRHRCSRADVDRDTRWRVQHRSVLHIGPLTHDDGRIVGAQYGVEPHRRPGLDRDIADQGGGQRDEGSGIDLRRSALKENSGIVQIYPRAGTPASGRD